MNYPAILALALTVTACGDDDGGGLTGTFEVTSHTISSDGCDTADAVEDPSECPECVIGKPYFKVKRESLFGQTFHLAINCDSAETCDDDNDEEGTIDLSGLIFEERSGDGLTGEALLAGYGGANCGFTKAEYVLMPTDDGVQITRTEYRLKEGSPSAMLKDDDCLDLTEDPPPADELECQEREIVVGRVPD